MSGRRLYQRLSDTLPAGEYVNLKLDDSEIVGDLFPKGVYVLQLESNSGTVSKRFLKWN